MAKKAKASAPGFRIINERTELVPIGSVQPHPRNVNQADLGAIVESEDVNGFYGSLIVQESTGYILAGTHRWRGAQQLGAKEIPATFIRCSDAEAIRIMLADNRTTRLGVDDPAALAELLQSLPSLDGTGFDAAALDEILADLGIAQQVDGLTDPDSAPEPPEAPVTVAGDLWLLGPHRVLCGDSTSIDAVERLLDGQKPNTMVTDPPYGVKLDQTWRDKALGSRSMGPGNKNTVSADDRADWYDAWVLFPGDVAYIWHASAFTDVVKDSLERANFETKQQIIWNKSIMVMGRSDYHWKHEPCWYAIRKGKTHNWTGDRTQVTVWDAIPPNHIMGGSQEDKTSHPTQKPCALYDIPIKNHTNPGEYLYEPFGGSGTALIACEKSGRRSLTMELDPKYVDVIVTRWQDFTGKTARLESTGQTFEEVKFGRRLGAQDALKEEALAQT